MDVGIFDKIVEDRIEDICLRLNCKAKEYATGGEDRLYNFKQMALIDETTCKRAVWQVFLKHLVSVKDLVNGNLENTEQMVNEKLGDCIAYFILLEAILFEERKVK